MVILLGLSSEVIVVLCEADDMPRAILLTAG